MNDEVVQDLKQFIAATVTQQTSDLRGDFDSLSDGLKGLEIKLGDKIDKLNQKLSIFSYFCKKTTG